MSTEATAAAPIAKAADRLLIGLIGAGIQKSRSPAQHEGEAAAHGLRCLYQLIDLDRLGLGVEHLPELLTAAERFGFAGVNVTYPCKQAVIPYLTSLSPEAASLGAVNTVVFADGRRIGNNTDCRGYASAFSRGLPDAELGHVALFGAGGAGAAAAYALLSRGTKRLSVVDTDDARAERLAAQMERQFGTGRAVVAHGAEAAVAEADGVVNATPVGMHGIPGTPFPLSWLTPRHWVSEIVCFPVETELLVGARAIGCRTLDGRGMNVLQAAEAFHLFTGLEPDAARMGRHFDGAAGLADPERAG